MKKLNILLTALVTSSLYTGCTLGFPITNNNSFTSLNSSSNVSIEKDSVKIEITNSKKEGNVINPKDVVLKDTKHSIESKMLNNLQVLHRC